MRETLRAHPLIGGIRPRDEKEHEVPKMRQREGRAADLHGRSENFEKELRKGQKRRSLREFPSAATFGWFFD
jgi:hypothetical protein